VVEGARLESEYTAKPYRGFESLPLRHSPEGERKGLCAGIEELDREGSVADRAFLADQLVEPLIGDGTRSLCVGVDPGVPAWELAVLDPAQSQWLTGEYSPVLVFTTPFGPAGA
jgi:hypothetical protein